MLKNLKLSLVAVAVISLSGCFSKDVEIKKTQISDNGIEFTENFVFKNSVFKLDESDIAFIEQLNADKRSFEGFRDLNFNDLKAIQDYDFNLSKEENEDIVIYARKKIFYEIQKIRQEKESEVDKYLSDLKSEHLSSMRDLEYFENNIEKYMEDLVPLVNKKRDIDKRKIQSSLDIDRWSASLAYDINEFLVNAGEKGDINPNHFTKIREENLCDKDYIIKKKTVNFYNLNQGVCLMTYVPMKKENSNKFITDDFLLTKTKETLKNISDEMINQGIIKTSSKSKFQLEYDEIEIKLAAAYKKTEKKFDVTRYQLEGRKALLQEIVKKKLEKFDKEVDLKFKKINEKMKLEDLNRFKPMMLDSELEYIRTFREDILGSAISSERESFEIVKITPDETKNEVFLIVDQFKDGQASYLDVIVVDINDLKKDREIMDKYNGKPIPLEVAEQTPHLYRYKGGVGADTVSDALVTVKKLLEE